MKDDHAKAIVAAILKLGYDIQMAAVIKSGSAGGVARTRTLPDFAEEAESLFLSVKKLTG
jgi:hypothetical protein